MISRVDKQTTSTEIVEEVEILKANRWIKKLGFQSARTQSASVSRNVDLPKKLVEMWIAMMKSL